LALLVDFGPDLERRLRATAAEAGKSPEEFVRAAVESRLAPRRKQGNREELIALLRRWREEPPDLEEAEGYPTTIEPLRLREVQIDP
jgi:hypothetical protein